MKNSLAIVASMLRLQASDVSDNAVTQHLEEASYRVAAVARAHDQLNRSPDLERLDVGKYIESVCKDLDKGVAHCEVQTDIEHGIEIITDRAVSAALIVNELITNAAKYAYQDRSGGKIQVTIARVGDSDFSISVRDEGAGLPAGFDFDKARGLGMRIVNALSRQLKGKVAVRSHSPGTEFVVTIPRQDRQSAVDSASNPYLPQR